MVIRQKLEVVVVVVVVVVVLEIKKLNVNFFVVSDNIASYACRHFRICGSEYVQEDGWRELGLEH